MKKLPIGIQTFRKLIDEDFLYVDKTKDIFQLLADGGQYYFLSRPRRFGKSLLVSTLKEIFLGNRDLFKDLWIHDKIQWKEYPVVHLDFLGLKYDTPEELTKTLEYMIDQSAAAYKVQLDESGYDKRFKELIRKLSQREKVVVLVDEYDKPIINHIENPDIAKQNRDILRTFYEAIKGSDEYIRFVFITGVSKFSKVSIFSGLNNLDDITVHHKFATLLGYTHDDVLHYFGSHLQGHPEHQIKQWYDGYSWDGEHFVYNPLSILHFIDRGKFGNFWFSTSTPTFLINFIRKYKIDVKRIENYETSQLLFDSFDIERINVFALLFQTGYLTIKEVDEISPTQTIYRLSYPNQEVKEAFLEYIAADVDTTQHNIGNYLTETLS